MYGVRDRARHGDADHQRHQLDDEESNRERQQSNRYEALNHIRYSREQSPVYCRRTRAHRQKRILSGCPGESHTAIGTSDDQPISTSRLLAFGGNCSVGAAESALHFDIRIADLQMASACRGRT